MTTKMKMNNCGWVVVDSQGECMLFDPTEFYLFETDTDVIIPFVYDSGRYTVFRDEEMLDELYAAWGKTIDEMEFNAVPLIDVMGEMMSCGVDNKD